MITEFLVFFTIFILFIFKFNQKPKGLPPGYWGLPLIGVIPVGNRAIEKIVERLKTKYGNGGIYCSKLGGRPGLLLTDCKIIKAAFNRAEFTARPDLFTIVTFGEGLGVTMSGGVKWQSNRRFMVRVLKDFGMGKSILESQVEREVAALIEHLDTKIGQPSELTHVINLAVLNILWGIMTGRRFDLEDEGAHELTTMAHDNLKILRSRVIILDAYPMLEKYLPNIIKNRLLKVNVLKSNREVFKMYMMKIIKEHVEKLDQKDPQNLIDMYLADIQENNTDPDLAFRKDLTNLAQLMINIFNAGGDLTPSTIRWLIIYLVIHPEWQKRIQEQIDENITEERIVHYREKEKLPLLDACIHETIRKSSLVPFGVPHVATEDTDLEGYRIPKGFIVVSALEEGNNDPKYWEHPMEFYPQHFLKEDGTFNGKRESFMSFSLGKRMCPGEAVVKNSLFTFGAALLQRYNIKAAPGEVLTYEADRSGGVINFPKQYKFIFEKRQ